MEVEQSNLDNREILNVSQSAGMLAIVFTVLPILVISAVAMVMLTIQVPLPLMMLLGAVLASSIALAMSSVRLLGPVTLTLDAAGLTCKRLTSRTTYSWQDISELRLVAADGSFADDTSSDAMKQIGIGVFLLSSQVAGDEKAEADEILVSATSNHVIAMQSLLTTLVQHKSRALSGAGTATGPKRMGPAQKPVAEFRKRARVASPTA